MITTTTATTTTTTTTTTAAATTTTTTITTTTTVSIHMAPFLGGDLAPSLGGRKKCHRPRVLNDVFSHRP